MNTKFLPIKTKVPYIVCIREEYTIYCIKTGIRYNSYNWYNIDIFTIGW